MKKREKPKKRSGYWIETHWLECGACGRERGCSRERVYDRPKPKEWLDRNTYTIDYCYCLE